MNILIVTDFFFPDTIGGSGRVVAEVSKRLVRKGHEIHVLTRRVHKGLPLREKLYGVSIWRYNITPQNIITFSISSLVNTFRAFHRVSNEISFDLVNYHHPLSALGANLSKRTKKIPKVYTFHSPWHKEFEIKTGKKGMGSLLRKYIERKVLKSCDKITVLSQYMKEQLESIHRIPSSQIEVISGGVDTTKFQPLEDKHSIRARLNLPQNKFLFLTVRKLVPRMGLENLIRAMKYVVKKQKDVLLIIGGQGFLKDKLERLTKKLNLGNYVKLIGFVEDRKLPLYYQAADLFILPTQYLEGFGMVTLEALASGLPVLGTPVGGTKEILGRLDKDLLFKGTDPHSLSDLILKYITSPERLTKIAKKCRDFVLKYYSWEVIIPKLEKFYIRVYQNRKSHE